jgi:hemerythrin-like domain-containing protein
MLQLHSRRAFLKTGLAGSALLFSPIKLTAKEEGKVSTNEDLMREHGVLKRVLLAYDRISSGIANGEAVPVTELHASARIINDFIEQYHEKLEEDHLFPRFRNANKFVDLVDVLLVQHQAGRKVTARILAFQSGGDAAALKRDLDAFVRMYAPHEAREDTVLFPALHEIVSPHEYDAMGEQFETIEHKTFGGEGFEIYRDKIAAIEKQLGIYDLAQFTPA